MLKRKLPVETNASKNNDYHPNTQLNDIEIPAVTVSDHDTSVATNNLIASDTHSNLQDQNVEELQESSYERQEQLQFLPPFSTTNIATILRFSHEENIKIRQIQLESPERNSSLTGIENDIFTTLLLPQNRKYVVGNSKAICWNKFRNEFIFQCQAYIFTKRAKRDEVYSRTQTQLEERNKTLKRKLRK
jgi:hypothetical protein